MARISSADTKRRLTAAALDMVAQHGVEGATTTRIAQAAGLSQAALYKHFPTRNDLLLAALDSMYDTIHEVVLESSSEPNVIERLRTIGRLHSDLIVSGRGSFIYPLFEFLAAPPESGLREAQGVRQLQMIQSVAAMVEEGKTQGSISPDVDSEQVGVGAPRCLVGRGHRPPDGARPVRDRGALRHHSQQRAGEAALRRRRS